MSLFESWGRYPKVVQTALTPAWTTDIHLREYGHSMLPQGQARSYGDCCLNDKGTIVSTRSLDRFVSFDPRTGILACESGVTLEAILDLVIPHGWFLPVTPGTKFVSVGGAIANDIHGKNHHREGTFGCHVLSFRLLRSDGELKHCSPTENSDFFRATIAGLGLTGLILDVVIQLKKISSAWIDMDSIQCRNLDEFFAVSKESDTDYEYTVAWIDCLAKGSSMGRGVFMRGNHSTVQIDPPRKKKQVLSVPVDLPGWTLNTASVSAFNFLYYNKQLQRNVHKRVSYEPFFYPLDSVLHWNRIYGKRGFLQFQCVVPSDPEQRAIRTILKTIVDSKNASFLAVLKEFGDISSPGLLSFPRKGVTLCLDFALAGQSTLDLFRRLDDMVADFDGAIYPAKDATMSAKNFQRYFPRWRELNEFIDERFSSSFWRRVTCVE